MVMLRVILVVVVWTIMNDVTKVPVAAEEIMESSFGAVWRLQIWHTEGKKTYHRQFRIENLKS